MTPKHHAASTPKSQQILAQIAERKNRIRELVDQRNAASDRVEQASVEVSKAIIDKADKDLADARARVRAGSEECGELSRSIAMLESAIVPLEADLKDAQRIEAIAEAQQLEAEARAGVAALREFVDNFVATLLPQCAELNAKWRETNDARSAAKRAGGASSEMSRVGVPLSTERLDPFLGAFVGEAERYALNQRIEANRDRRNSVSRSTESAPAEPATEPNAVAVE